MKPQKINQLMKFDCKERQSKRIEALVFNWIFLIFIYFECVIIYILVSVCVCMNYK